MTSPLNISVSCFKNSEDTTARTVNLMTWLNSMKYKNEVDQVRAIANKKERDVLKKKLPGFTPSGLFSKRADNCLTQHSGLIAFDIDFAENEHITNYKELKEQIKNIKNVAYCALSCSGTGYWGLIPIANPDKHKSHFKALEDAFKKLGIKIDTSCKNVSRLRFYSYDPDAYFNHNAITFTGLYEQAPAQPIKYRSTNTTNPRPLEIAVKIIHESQDGQKWECLNRAAYLLGGYIAAGTISENEARQTLQSAISAKANVANLQAAFKTIDNGLKHGQNKPIYQPIKSEPVKPLSTNTDFLLQASKALNKFSYYNLRKRQLETYLKTERVMTTEGTDFITFCENLDNEYQFNKDIQ